MAQPERGRLLITRSQPGADSMARALNEAGYRTSVCPMLNIEPLSTARDKVQRLGPISQVVCLSLAAARHGVPMLIEGAPDIVRGANWIAVGRGTADALREAGIDATFPPVETSEGLLALPDLAQLKGQRILLLSGEGGRTLLADELRKRGAEPIRLAVYRRTVPGGELLRDADIDIADIAAVIVSSGEGGSAWAHCWQKAGGSLSVPVVVPSARVAVQMRTLGCAEVLVSGGASAEAVINLLDSTADRSGLFGRC